MEKENTNPTEETQVEESQLNSATGDEAVSEATADTLTLAELNELTGKTYKDKESAVKSLKDTYSQAGKAADLEGKLRQAESQGEPDDRIKQLQEQLAQTQTEVFFSNNPEHKQNRELLERIAKADGVSIQEAIESDVYKNVAENLKVAESTQSMRTVASSNNRVAQSGGEQKFDAKGKSATEIADYVAQTYIK